MNIYFRILLAALMIESITISNSYSATNDEVLFRAYITNEKKTNAGDSATLIYSITNNSTNVIKIKSMWKDCEVVIGSMKNNNYYSPDVIISSGRDYDIPLIAPGTSIIRTNYIQSGAIYSKNSAALIGIYKIIDSEYNFTNLSTIIEKNDK